MSIPNESPTAAERERLRRHYQDVLGHYKSANAELTDLSWTLADLEQQIAALHTADPAASQGALRRLRDLQRWKEALEDSVLTQMYRVDTLQHEISVVRRALSELVVGDPYLANESP